jgi:hypothetical protein
MRGNLAASLGAFFRRKASSNTQLYEIKNEIEEIGGIRAAEE